MKSTAKKNNAAQVPTALWYCGVLYKCDDHQQHGISYIYIRRNWGHWTCNNNNSNNDEKSLGIESIWILEECECNNQKGHGKNCTETITYIHNAISACTTFSDVCGEHTVPKWKWNNVFDFFTAAAVVVASVVVCLFVCFFYK